MNTYLKDIMDKNVPRISKKIVDGVSDQILKHAPEYIDTIFRHSVKSVPEDVGFRYEGYRLIQPDEEYDKIYASKDNKVPFDLASSDIHLVEWRFSYQGQLITKYAYLPYSREGNLMRVSGVEYHIVPVLSDTVISPSHKKIFVRIHKNKINFKHISKNFIVNGRKKPGHVIYTDMFRVNTSYVEDNLGKQFTAAGLYLLAKFGLRKSLSKYTDIRNVIVTDNNEIAAQYQNGDYIIYESTKIKPRGLKVEVYRGHNVKIIVPVTNMKNQQYVENIIFGLIYTLDILPEHADEFVEIFNSEDIENEIYYWKIMLGRVAYRNAYSVIRISKDITEHFMSIEGYMDSMTQERLRESNIYVDDFFDTIQIIMEKYNIWLINSKEYNSNINNRYIDILYYLFYDTILGFNKVTLAINKRLSKKLPSYNEVKKVIDDNIKTKKVFNLTKARETNLAVNLVEANSDIKYPKITSILEDR